MTLARRPLLSLPALAVLCGAAALLLPASAARAAEQTPIVTLDPAQAGRDFAFQGEYAGKVQTEDGEVAIGLQVIALGQGKFDAVAFPGGLPGAGWNGEERFPASGERSGDQLVLRGDHGEGIVADGKVTVRNADGKTLGTLEKVERKSPTLGAKPPEGAVVLFDGTSAEQFENGQLDGRLLKEGTQTKQKFQDCTLHIEFQLSFMPEARGQGRANSGCYLQARYETQILDSFGLTGENNECGGLYSVKRPDINMCLPPLSWQTYDVEFTTARFDDAGKKTANARMTVRHNGVVVHDDVEVPHSTTASPLKEGPEPGPVYLQNHGNPIRFRNIWVVPKSAG